MVNTSFKKIKRFTFFTLFALFFAKMFKFNRYSHKTYISALSVFIFAVLLSGCMINHTEEIKRVEELQELLNENEKNLNLDVSLFKLRAEHIETTLRTFRNDYTKIMSKELGDNLSKYKNLKKIYTYNSGKYDANVKEQVELSSQLENLIQDLKAGKLSKEEFKSYYRTEKADIEQLIAASKDIGKRMYEIEPEFIRLDTYFQPLLEKLKD